MIRQRTAQMNNDGGNTTRRTFLAGVGTLTITGFGTTTSGATTTATTGFESPFTNENPLPGSDELEAFVDDVMERRIGDAMPGATIAIVQGDDPIHVKGYGDADSNTPVQAAETAFRVGSVGKLVTWTAIMQGVERGVLDLDDDVNTYLDGSDVTIPETYDEPVTLRHLGTHTAGFESALDPDVVDDPDAVDPLEVVLAEHRPSRVRPPGEKVGYSNWGTALAGHIVAEAHDTTFEEYVQSKIFEPLGMTHSTFAQPVPDDYPSNLATGHTRDDQTFETADTVYINMRPAGSMTATASDMAAFMSAHLGDGAVGNVEILSADTAQTMHDQHYVRHPAVTNWRYGFHEYGTPDANFIGHSGATIYFSSHLVLAPDHDIGIFVNYNSNSDEHAPPAAVVDEILAEYGIYPSSTTPTPTSEPGGQERAEIVAGEYSLTYLPQSGPLQVVDLLERVSVESTGDRRLRTATLEGGARQWIEIEPYVYQEVDGRDALAFEVTDGDVEVMNMSSEPTGGYTPVPFHERQLVTGGVLAGALIGFGLSLAGWGTTRTWQRLNERYTEGKDDMEGST